MSARRSDGSRGLERALRAGVLAEVVAASGMSPRAARALGRAQLALLDKLGSTSTSTSTLRELFARLARR